jgi:hypothetical protein
LKEGPPCAASTDGSDRGPRSEEPPRWSSAASPPAAKACGRADETSSSTATATVTEAASLHSTGCSSVALEAAVPPRAAGSATDGFGSVMTVLLRVWAVAG